MLKIKVNKISERTERKHGNQSYKKNERKKKKGYKNFLSHILICIVIAANV